MDRKLPAASSEDRFMKPSICTTLRDPRSIIEAAEQAAAADDYIAAEELLREAVAAQEASLGPLHPDLANTLNNLGVVCERNDHPRDAEHCFRRAVGIATTVLEPNHPFVVTSRQNLRDFCVARGRPIELLLLPAAATKTKETRATPPVPQRSARPLAMNFLGPGIMLAMILAATFMRPAPSDVEGLGSTQRAEPQTIGVGSTAKASVSGVDAVGASRIPDATSAPAPPAVVKAQLCTTLDEWLCEPADVPVTAGPLFFYTQVTSTVGTMIQHRWYRDDRLTQSVDLPIQASPRVGYRSFSRLTMDSESAGSWRVELRTEDGVLLHEERFTVR